MNRKYYLLLFFPLMFSCQEKSLTDAQEIVDKAIEAHGGTRFDNLSLAFDFRGRHYTSDRKGGRMGKFTYTRTTIDSTGTVRDVLHQASRFTRYLNGREINISDERKTAFTSSVNSVLYFALLPYPLNDVAARKEFLGEREVEGKPYYKVKVTFAEEQGGEDYQDVFCYWFHKETFTMDYIAYSYEEEDGWGTRFRKAINSRRVGGILFQDYINHKPPKSLGLPPVEEHDELFESGQLEVLSEIISTNVVVNAQQPS